MKTFSCYDDYTNLNNDFDVIDEIRKGYVNCYYKNSLEETIKTIELVTKLWQTKDEKEKENIRSQIKNVLSKNEIIIKCREQVLESKPEQIHKQNFHDISYFHNLVIKDDNTKARIDYIFGKLNKECRRDIYWNCCSHFCRRE